MAYSIAFTLPELVRLFVADFVGIVDVQNVPNGVDFFWYQFGEN